MLFLLALACAPPSVEPPVPDAPEDVSLDEPTGEDAPGDACGGTPPRLGDIVITSESMPRHQPGGPGSLPTFGEVARFGFDVDVEDDDGDLDAAVLWMAWDDAIDGFVDEDWLLFAGRREDGVPCASNTWHTGWWAMALDGEPLTRFLDYDMEVEVLFQVRDSAGLASDTRLVTARTPPRR